MCIRTFGMWSRFIPSLTKITFFIWLFWKFLLNVQITAMSTFVPLWIDCIAFISTKIEMQPKIGWVRFCFNNAICKRVEFEWGAECIFRRSFISNLQTILVFIIVGSQTTTVQFLHLIYWHCIFSRFSALLFRILSIKNLSGRNVKCSSFYYWKWFAYLYLICVYFSNGWATNWLKWSLRKSEGQILPILSLAIGWLRDILLSPPTQPMQI